MIKFNADKNRYEGMVDGKIVVKGKKAYVEHILKLKFGIVCNETSGSSEVSVPAEPKEYFSVDERFDFIQQFVKLITKKVVHSFIVTGSGGLGKTHTVIETLKKLGKTENTVGSDGGDFVTIKGFSTPKGLYRSLFENNGKIIIFDDADSVFRDPIGANLFKAALESSPKRVISWNAEFSESESLPNRFEFTGQVIFVSNLSIDKFPQAILSRSSAVDLTLNTEEKVQRIEHVLKEIPADAEDKMVVLEFIRKYAPKAKDLNIRSALQVLKLRKALGDGFERLALYSFTT